MGGVMLVLDGCLGMMVCAGDVIVDVVGNCGAVFVVDGDDGAADDADAGINSEDNGVVGVDVGDVGTRVVVVGVDVVVMWGVRLFVGDAVAVAAGDAIVGGDVVVWWVCCC